MTFSGIDNAPIEHIIVNDAFYPEIVVNEFMIIYKISSEYAEELIVQQLVSAISDVNRSLRELRDNWGIKEITHISQVSDDLINDENVLIHHYKKSIYTRAKAFLLKHFATIERKEIAEAIANDMPSSFEFLLEESNQSLRYIKNKPRITAELL